MRGIDGGGVRDGDVANRFRDRRAGRLVGVS